MKSLLTWAGGALLDAVAPRKWLLIRTDGGTSSVSSSHRTRAAAVLAIPVDCSDYGIIRRDQFEKLSALAAFSAPDITTIPKEER